MEKSYFKELLRKYLQGNATATECRFLISYYNLFENEPDIIDLLSGEEKKNLKDQTQLAIWNKIQKHEKKQKNRIINLSLTAAAAAIAFVFCTITLIQVFNEPSVPQQTVTRKVHHHKNRFIHLPDGSKVILCAGSKLNYPSSFAGLTKREVYLEGQAFFDIQHDASQPFVVHTGKLETTVLGTAFNIKAWPANANITVTVSRGKVKVGNKNKTMGIISPNQQIIFNKKNAEVNKRNVDASSYLTWKEQDLFFDNLTFEEASELLAERFNVNIFFSNDFVRSKRFTTTFLKDESLEQVLKSICEFNNAAYHYNREEKTVFISNMH